MVSCAVASWHSARGIPPDPLDQRQSLTRQHTASFDPEHIGKRSNNSWWRSLRQREEASNELTGSAQAGGTSGVDAQQCDLRSAGLKCARLRATLLL